MSIYLSVVIPAYNEEDNIKSGVLSQVYNYLKKQDFSWEVLLVDDESTDSTLKLLQKFVFGHKGFKVITEPHRGKAGTVIAGSLKASGEIVLFTDMDQATPIDQLEKVLPEFDKGYDVVIGSRTGRAGAPLVRKAMAMGFVILRTVILRLPYKDTQCGFKAFTKDAALRIFKRMQIFDKNTQAKGASVFAGFDLETLYIAKRMGLKIAEVQVVWRHKGTVRVDPIKDSWEGFRDLVKIRANSLLGKYKFSEK